MAHLGIALFDCSAGPRLAYAAKPVPWRIILRAHLFDRQGVFRVPQTRDWDRMRLKRLKTHSPGNVFSISDTRSKNQASQERESCGCRA